MFFNLYPYLNVTDLNLDYVLKLCKSVAETVESLDSWRSEHEEEYNQLLQLVNNLDGGNWSPEYVNALTQFFSDNLVEIVGELVKQVYFGVTDDGHFVAYIPESWDDITFGTTGYDDFPVGIDYGHLTLAY